MELQKDARTTFSEIAKSLNVKAGVVQVRYTKMVQKGLIKGATLILDYSKTGLPYSAGLEIKVIESRLDEVAKFARAIKIKNANISISTVIGQYDILAIIDTRTLIDVHKFKQLIKQHPGVREVSISIKKNFYYNYRMLNAQLLNGG